MAPDNTVTAPDRERLRTTAPRSPLRSALSTQGVPVLGALIVVAMIAIMFVDMFGTARNVNFLVLSIAAIAMIALPMTFIIITGEIDLSVASTLALTSATLGLLWESGVSLEAAIPIVLLLGLVLGALNGFLTTVCGLPSLAVTIGTMALYRGLAYVLLGDRAVASYPQDWVSGIRQPFLGIQGLPWIAVAIAVMAIVFAVLLHATAFGRSLYDIGNNDEAARFTGVSVKRTKFWLFTLSGAVASGAGILWTLQYGTSRADTAMGLELQVVAAVLLGGVSIFGGVGSVLGVMSGVLMLGVIRNALQLFGIGSDVLQVVTGAILIASVVAPNIVARVRSRRAPAPPTGAVSGDRLLNGEKS